MSVLLQFCQNKNVKLVCGLLIFLFFSQNLFADWVEDQIQQLPGEDRKFLQCFFSTAIKRDQLGYVLFFPTKPACLTGTSVTGKLSEDFKFFIKGWNVWKTIEHDFPHPNFIIYDEQVDLRGEIFLHIYFINKKTLSEELSKHEKTFKEILGDSFSKETFVKNLEQKKVNSLFKENQALIGLILGYGIESSLRFKPHEKKEESNIIICASKEKVDIHSTPKGLLCTMEKTQVHPVTFIGNPKSKEVQQLKTKYAEELEKIETIYQEKDLLSVCLHALCN